MLLLPGTRRCALDFLATIFCSCVLLLPAFVQADPCGMVPSIQVEGPQQQLTRTGHQRTYVFYKDGLETMVLRPAFSGNVDEFGMLIPFPTPPAIRKMPDQIFDHIAAAVDPPEVVCDVRPMAFGGSGGGGGGLGGGGFGGGLGFAQPAVDKVHVLRQEAVGMYEVAVLAAGSSGALRRWMVDHKYRYPEGMDEVCDAYVAKKWCFVAVKTRVAQKKASDPQPGQREVKNKLPGKAMFDGAVQAMGFRFPAKELVVPMRLSVFNQTDQEEGELRNVVYILTDRPAAIRSIPEEYVRRQIYGDRLYANLTQPLPLRVLGGTIADVNKSQRNWLPSRRKPEPQNGLAAELFTSDLLAVRNRALMSGVEHQTKQFGAINERLLMRGEKIDNVVNAHTAETRQQVKAAMLDGVKRMTLTVIDGDFPREHLASNDLTIKFHRIAAQRNHRENYDALRFGPHKVKPQGKLYLGQLPPARTGVLQVDAIADSQSSFFSQTAALLLTATILAGVIFWVRRIRLR